MSILSFQALRAANELRLPEFKNSKGEHAHARNDGSDWNPAQWLQAVVGELGEYAEVRVQYDEGKLTHEEFVKLATKELADVQTYFDILCRRALDTTELTEKPDECDCAQVFQKSISLIGGYANCRKKYERGDISWAEFDAKRFGDLFAASGFLKKLSMESDRKWTPVLRPHAVGVDLSSAVADKFNEVSKRIGSTVTIVAGSPMYYVHRETPTNTAR